MQFFLAAVMMAFLSLSINAGELRKETNEYYVGTIEGKYEFKMVLSKETKSCSGSYYYLKHKKPIFLFGTCSDSKIELQEQVDKLGYYSKKKSNTIHAGIVGGEIKGRWISSDGKIDLDFFATRVVPNKGQLLGDAVGKYALKNISGFYGANTMTDIYKANNKWKSTGSSISAGMRQGFGFDLSEREKKLLSSFALVVDENRAITITAGGRLIASFPFTEESEFSVTKMAREEDTIDRIFVYKDAGSFIENELHIATTDKFGMSSYLAFEATPIDDAHVMSLNYDPITLEFKMRVFDKNCCGSTSLYFEKN